jgi:hypothetical protein
MTSTAEPVHHDGDMSGLQTWLDTKTEFLSGAGALAFSKISLILSGFAAGRFQNFWKIHPDW